MRKEYDYVIVGAGSAGCVLAYRLSAKPDLKVLVLEAGEPEQGLYHKAPAAFPKLFKGPSDWAFYTAPQPELNGRELYWPRGRVLGGSSSINAMIVIRGNPRDYDDWQQPGWAFAEVLPYFKKLETHPLGPSEYHGDRGPLHVEERKYTNPLSHAFIEAAMQWGLPRNDDFNGATQEGVGLFHVNQKNGARHSAASAYLRPALPRPNLDVQTGARAHRILWEGARAVGVEYRHQGQLWQVRARRGVIVSSGAVQSPQLLMLSGIGPAEHLKSHGLEVRQDLPVGQNLWDHLALPVIWHCKAPVSLDKAETLANILRYLLTQRGPFVSNVAEAGAFVRTRPQAPAPDLQFHFGPAFFSNHGFDREEGHFFTIGPTLVAPQSRGWIGLKSADPEDAPLIQPHYLREPADLEVLRAGMELAREIAAQKAFDAYRGQPHARQAEVQSAAEMAAYIRQHAQTLYHPAGTCSMGQVVDAHLKVYGTEHLYVVDASVMPGVVRGNTHIPTLMVAERAADLLLGV
ncbi:GMC family oxidoreductase N-terminal domain-containing protein [Meiothermus sp. CFH 77666]|uniref:GMC family oxidoreductase n=1 Tax=Meiothermus sp. CFH 77666 TaxID=2817942 RepID=UPI001AA02F79|nr:GMC family oxidoreductase N-terminal domain-containing protein [Meiothermus sp. CFH 77666]MBO1436624.1 GMC family oxidoreductase N-terminal domain-containing protein [Meiothermus sp. CFH 77666]